MGNPTVPIPYVLGTVGLVYGKSVWSIVAALIQYRTSAPKMIPITPASIVKNTDSKMI